MRRNLEVNFAGYCHGINKYLGRNALGVLHLAVVSVMI